MTENNPLRGLDDVRWGGLRHAYGAADDVPGQIRALRSADSDEREKAYGELYCNIFHQGSRYEAAVHAVPFLLALAGDPATPERSSVLALLGSLAIGYDESWLPEGVDTVAWRAAVAAMDPDDPVTWLARQELAAYEAVRAGVPRLCALLGDPDSDVRATAVWVLAWFPEEAARIRPALSGLLTAERAPGVVANAVVAAGLLGDDSLVPRLREWLAGDEPLTRWAAAVALARLAPADPAVIDVLASSSAEPPGQTEPVVMFHEGDLRAYASASLVPLDPPEEAITAVLAGLSRTSGLSAFAPTLAALRLAFGAEPPESPPAFDELTEPQRRTVRTLAEMDEETWQWLNFSEFVHRWKLPDEREACRRYAGLATDRGGETGR
jgi:HEAT repeat protein